MQHSKTSPTDIAVQNRIADYTKPVIIAFLFLISLGLNAQTKPISLTAKNTPIKTVLTEIQQKSGYRILYNDEVVADDLKVTIEVQNKSIEKVLDAIFGDNNLTYVIHPNQLVVITDKKFIKTTSEVFGTVVDENNEPVPFANVLFFQGNDTTKAAYATVTDLKGNFQLLRVKHGDYNVVISFVGFETIHQSLTVNDNENNVYRMKPETRLLDEVVVKADEVRSSINKSTYQILSKDIVGARTAMDLIEKVPQLHIDRINEKIISSTGKTIKILVNGINATEIDLRTLRPENILRMEYYDIPPARYAEFGSVLNVITKEHEDGLAAGINLMSIAFTTGFVNNTIYLKYNKGKHQFSFDHSIYRRNYRDRQYGNTYEYRYKNVDYVRETNGKDKFGYDDNYINFTYSNQEEDKYAFQTRVSPNFMTYHADGDNQIEYFADDTKTTRTGTSTSRRKVFSPVVDLYYWKQLNDKQELALNVVGTAFNTSNIYSNKEYSDDGVLALNDDMNEQNRKYSIIGEANYMKTLGFGTLNFGYNIEANTMYTDIENSFDDTNYQTSYLQNYAYSEITARKNKWMWMASIGLSNRRQNSYQNKRNDWIFRPRATVGYSFSSSHSLRLLFERRNSEPSLSSLSNNKVYITDQIIRQGNPMLRHSITNELVLIYTLNTNYFNLIVAPTYEYVQRPTSSYFTEGDDYIVRMAENGIKSYQYGLQYNVVLKPFGSELLSLRASGRVMNREQYTSQIGYFKHLYAPFWYNIAFSHKGVRAYFQGNIPSKSLSGPYISSDENNAHVGVSYSKNDWSVSAGLWWIGQPSQYFTNTIPESIVQYNSYTHIYDNRNMFTLGFSYSFNKGKKYNEKQKTLQNSDTDSGMF